jgi:hypothetical protein
MSQTRSSYEPTRLTAGQAATTAPTGPWDQPCAMFAVRVAAMPSASSQRAREGTDSRHTNRAAVASASLRPGAGARPSQPPAALLREMGVVHMPVYMPRPCHRQ